MSREYHYVGTLEGRADSVWLGLSADVRTRMLACDDCGAVVPEGRGERQHDNWHRALTATVGHFPLVTW